MKTTTTVPTATPVTPATDCCPPPTCWTFTSRRTTTRSSLFWPVVRAWWVLHWDSTVTSCGHSMVSAALRLYGHVMCTQHGEYRYCTVTSCGQTMVSTDTVWSHVDRLWWVQILHNRIMWRDYGEYRYCTITSCGQSGEYRYCTVTSCGQTRVSTDTAQSWPFADTDSWLVCLHSWVGGLLSTSSELVDWFRTIIRTMEKTPSQSFLYCLLWHYTELWNVVNPACKWMVWN